MARRESVAASYEINGICWRIGRKYYEESEMKRKSKICLNEGGGKVFRK
jgi:hypothetical protein